MEKAAEFIGEKMLEIVYLKSYNSRGGKMHIKRS